LRGNTEANDSGETFTGNILALVSAVYLAIVVFCALVRALRKSPVRKAELAAPKKFVEEAELDSLEAPGSTVPTCSPVMAYSSEASKFDKGDTVACSYQKGKQATIFEATDNGDFNLLYNDGSKEFDVKEKYLQLLPNCDETAKEDTPVFGKAVIVDCDSLYFTTDIYKIQVQVDILPEKSWFVFRTRENFETLVGDLKQEGQQNVPQLPDDGFVARISGSYGEKQTEGLQNFLNCILESPITSDSLRSFLEFEKEAWKDWEKDPSFVMSQLPPPCLHPMTPPPSVDKEESFKMPNLQLPSPTQLFSSIRKD